MTPRLPDAIIEGMPCTFLDWHNGHFERMRNLISQQLTGSFSIMFPARIDFYEPFVVPDKYAATLYAVITYGNERQTIIVVTDKLQNLCLSVH